MAEDSRVLLPGFGRPLKYYPKDRFPHVIADECYSEGVLVRERRMVEFINQISDQPGWDRKVLMRKLWGNGGMNLVWDEELQDGFLSADVFDYVSCRCNIYWGICLKRSPVYQRAP
jgi:hypothetical protein